MIDLIKTFMLMYVLTRPAVWIGLLITFTLILLLCALFIKFKNGWLSWFSFILFEVVGLVLIVSLTRNTYYSDNLKLKSPEVKSVLDVTEEGVVLERRFRPRATPLLGVEFPSGNNFQPVRERILGSCFDKKLFVCKSSAYTGVVLYDAENRCINEALLREGLAYISGTAPRQYIELQKRASETKQGIWAQPVVRSTRPCVDPRAIKEFILWLAFIQAGITLAVLVICLRRRKLELLSRITSPTNLLSREPMCKE